MKSMLFRHALLATAILLMVVLACPMATAQDAAAPPVAGPFHQGPGGLVGIGAVLEAQVDEDTGEDKVVIISVLPDGPAAKMEVRPGDRILEVDGEPVEGLTLREVVERIRGEEGTEVKFTLVREGEDEPIEVGMVRARIDLPWRTPGGPGGMMGPMLGGPGGMMGPMVGMMPQPQPVMLIDQGYLYILIGNVLFKLDAETLEQINAVHLIPPPPPPGMMGPPRPPPPPTPG